MKILVLGNSITHHVPSPDIGWFGDWGMAASNKEKDFVHILTDMLTDAGRNVICHKRNIADFERGKLTNIAEFLSDEKSFAPDVVVLRIGENVPDERLEQFPADYENLINFFKQDKNCTLLAVGSFWKNDKVENIISTVATKLGVDFLSLSSLHDDKYKAIGQFENYDVAEHPSDYGMLAIAEKIFAKMNELDIVNSAIITKYPDDEPVFDMYSVMLNGISAPVYQARVSAMPFNRVYPGYQRPVEQSEISGILSFDMKSSIDITVKSKDTIDDIVIRPLSKGIIADVEGDTARFTLREPGQYSIEINGRHHNLHIFANSYNNCAHDPNSYTYYFSAGRHEIETLQLNSGESVYIEAGAVVHGAIQAYDATDIRIEGYGILDYSKQERHDNLQFEKDGMINFVRCDGVVIDGIILRDSSWWTITSFNCTNLYFHNLKSIGMWRYNSDGFDFVNCQNVHVDSCFLRNFDDVIVLKGHRINNIWQYDHMNVKNFLIENGVLWCDWGGALEIGAETVADEYSNITFKNCDIIRADNGAMRIQSGDRAYIHNVLYDNIRIEYSKYDRNPVYQENDNMKYIPDDRPWVCDVIKCWMYCNIFTNDGILGNVKDITYRNIEVYADEGLPCAKISFNGADAEHIFDCITIDGFKFNGTKTIPEIEKNEFVGTITITEQK